MRALNILRNISEKRPKSQPTGLCVAFLALKIYLYDMILKNSGPFQILATSDYLIQRYGQNPKSDVFSNLVRALCQTESLSVIPPNSKHFPLCDNSSSRHQPQYSTAHYKQSKSVRNEILRIWKCHRQRRAVLHCRWKIPPTSLGAQGTDFVYTQILCNLVFSKIPSNMAIMAYTIHFVHICRIGMKKAQF